MAINRKEVVTFSVFIFVYSVRGRMSTKQNVVEWVDGEAEKGKEN